MNDDVVMHPIWMVDLAEYILLDYFTLASALSSF
jgi:hypothetical protein